MNFCLTVRSRTRSLHRAAMLIFSGLLISAGQGFGSQPQQPEVSSAASAQEPAKAKEKEETRSSKVTLQVRRDVVFHTVGKEALKADVYRLPDELHRPVVLMIHGGGWVSGDKWNMADHCREVARAGYVAVAINYRLAPKHKFPAQLEDCREALRWVVEQSDELRVEKDQVGLYGYSAGGHLAALLASVPGEDQSRVRCVVAGGAPCDFRQLPLENQTMAYFLGGSRKEKPEVYREASPASFVQSQLPPFFFFHGGSDLLVPPSSSLKMHQELEKVGAKSEYLEVKKLGHLATFFSSEARTKAVQFIQEHLPAEAK